MGVKMKAMGGRGGPAVINMMNCCVTTADRVIKFVVKKQFKNIHQS